MDIAILVIICTIVVQFDVTGISGLARHEFVTDQQRKLLSIFQGNRTFALSVPNSLVLFIILYCSFLKYRAFGPRW